MKRVSDLVTNYFDSHSIEKGGEYASFFSRWQEIAGPGLADHSKIADIKHGAVIIHVDHPGWMQKMSIQKNRILQMIQKRYPSLDIKNIYMRCVDGIQSKGISVEQQRINIEESKKRVVYEVDSVDSDPIELANRDLSRIDDPKLRELLERLSREGSSNSAD